MLGVTPPAPKLVSTFMARDEQSGVILTSYVACCIGAEPTVTSIVNETDSFGVARGEGVTESTPVLVSRLDQAGGEPGAEMLKEPASLQAGD